MPTVPSESDEDDMTSLASQKSKPRIGFQDPFRFPVGQSAQGTYGNKQWRQFQSLREAVKQRSVEESLQTFGDVGKSIGQKLTPGWDRMMKEGYKSKNVQVQPGGLSLDPTQLEEDVAKADAKAASKVWAQQGPTPTGPSQPTMKGIATENMGLTEQEQNLYQHHLDNLDKGGIKNKDGSKSTLLAITAGIGNKTYVLPTVWDNKIVSQDQAIENAKQKGLDSFPSYDDRTEATARYFQMHDYMEQDMK